ncbi:ribosomal subunit interface protein YfiA [Burkholderia pseudomallei]|nr:ribosomal subunit interface protein YfiA [Burkholderia pseudomallei]
MKLPLEISIQGMPRSAALEEAIARHAAKLERYCAEIIRCRVSVILDDKHKHQGKPFDVHVDVTIPGREIVSNRESDEDVYVALRDAFGNAERMLDDAASKRRDQRRDGPPSGGVHGARTHRSHATATDAARPPASSTMHANRHRPASNRDASAGHKAGNGANRGSP